MRTKQTIARWLRRAALVTLTVMTMAACIEYDEEMYSVPMGETTLPYQAVYEGEWTVNKQVVDTARLVVGPSLRVRLPELYLLGLFISDTTKTDKAGSILQQESATEIHLNRQGYSQQSEYMAFSTETIQSGNDGLLFVACSFNAIIDDVPHRISLLCRDNANAVMEKATGQWMLGIPLCSLLVTNMSTGESVVHNLPITVNLYYSTKQRIA